MDSRKFLFLSITIAFALTFSSLLYAKRFPWPDYEHIKYGFPLFWLIRVLSTIAGPTNFYIVNYGFFMGDLVFWFMVTLAVMWLLRQRMSNVKTKQ